MNMIYKKITPLLFLLFFIAPEICQSQFLDSFDNKKIEGWTFFTGDGGATMDFVPKDGHARIFVDATNDRHNVWWALIRRNISASLDLSKLKDPNFELRVEARVRVSDAPRRLNFMVNTQRTTDFHKQLREYDIADTTGWHTISMTTGNLDAVPGDSLFVQLGIIDWGLEKYHVDLDYYRADIIDVTEAGPDKGEPLLYHPPVPDTDRFSNHLDVTHDALINSDFPDVNFNDWQVTEQEGNVRVLTVDANQWAVLRWDFDQYKNAEADGLGLLELTTHSVSKGGNYIDAYGEELEMEFGKVRVVEILGGDPEWDQKTVTYNSLIQGNDLSEVVNGQMIIDIEPAEEPGSINYITIPRPVLQRLLDGKTKGLLIRPLGAINSSFYATENQSENSRPKLHFNIRE